MFTHWRFARQLAAALLVLAASPALAAPPVVRTDAGPVSGAEAAGVASYLGIPFAAPPVGDLRWRAPQPVAHWTGVRKADEFGAMCMQGGAGGGRGGRGGGAKGGAPKGPGIR